MQQEALAHHRQSPGKLESHGCRAFSQIAAPPKFRLQFITSQTRSLSKGHEPTQLCWLGSFLSVINRARQGLVDVHLRPTCNESLASHTFADEYTFRASGFDHQACRCKALTQHPGHSTCPA